MPSLVLALIGWFGVHWLSRYPSTDRAVKLPAFFHRMIFLLPVFTPFLPHVWQPYWLILSVTLPALAQGIASVIFISLMRESVTQERITALFSRRLMAMNIALAIGSLVFGYWLEVVVFPLNYQVMFVVAFLASMVSLWHVYHVYPMPELTAPPTRTGIHQPWQSPPFQRVAVLTGMAFMTFFSLVPIVPLWLVKRLDAGEGFIAVFGLVELAAAALASSLAPRLVKRTGEPGLAALGMMGTALSVLVIVMANELWITLFAAAIIGAFWALTDIGQVTFFTRNAPADSVTYSRAYYQLLSLAMFVGPLIGGQLASLGVDLLTVMLIGAGLRLLAALIALGMAFDHSEVIIKPTMMPRKG
jgi:predicted MFS family arabinose efflux permease